MFVIFLNISSVPVNCAEGSHIILMCVCVKFTLKLILGHNTTYVL